MSKFKGVIDASRARSAEPDAPPEPPKPATPAPIPSAEPPSPAPPESPSPRRPGRPKGKRSDPGYVQCTSYIPEDLHRRVKIALLQDGKGTEFSELVAELLGRWLESR